MRLERLLLSILAFSQTCCLASPAAVAQSTDDLPTVRLCQAGASGNPCDPEAPTFDDEGLKKRKSAIQGDEKGNFRFYASPGEYLLEVSKTDTVRHQIPVTIPPVGPGQDSQARVTVLRGGGFSLTLSGDLTVQGTVTARGAVTAEGPLTALGPVMVQANLSAPAVTVGSTAPLTPPPTGSVTIFTSSDGKLSYEDSSGTVVSLESKASPGTSVPSCVGPNETGVRWVTANGNDSNDGCTWNTAYATVYHARCSLPNGDCAAAVAGAGTILVGNGAKSGGPVSGQGIWTIGTDDPNFSSRLTAGSPSYGFLADNGPETFTCAGTVALFQNTRWGNCAVEGGASSDSATGPKPWFWMTGQGEFNASYVIDGVAPAGYPAVAVELGRNSNYILNGPGVGAVGVTIRHFGFNCAHAGAAAAGNGPGIEKGTNAYEFTLEDSMVCGTGSDASGGVTAYKAAAIAMTDIGARDIIRNVTVNWGGIRVTPLNGGGSLSIYGVECEGNLQACVWFTNGFAGSYSAFVEGVETDDCGIGACNSVENDGASAPALTVIPNGTNQKLVGQMTVLGAMSGEDVERVSLTPNQQSTQGFVGGTVWGQVDAARREGSPVAVRYQNAAGAGTFRIACQGAVMTNGIPDPYGGARASHVSCGSGLGLVQFFDSVTSLTVGQWYVAGVWLHPDTAAGLYDGSVDGIVTNGLQGGAKIVNYPLSRGSGMNIVDGLPQANRWIWYWNAFKVTNSGAGNEVIFLLSLDGTTPFDYFGQTLLAIPASDGITDAEAVELAVNLAPIPQGVMPGTITTMPGQPFAFGGTGNFFGILTQQNTANRTYQFPDVSGHVALTDVAQQWTAQQTFDSANLNKPIIDGQTLSAPPTATFSSIISGSLSAPATVSTFTPDFGIVITRVEITAKVPPQNCSANAVVRLSASQIFDETVSSGSNDSGALSIQVPGGAPITISVLAGAQSCLATPQDANIVVQYRMQ